MALVNRTLKREMLFEAGGTYARRAPVHRHGVLSRSVFTRAAHAVSMSLAEISDPPEWFNIRRSDTRSGAAVAPRQPDSKLHSELSLREAVKRSEENIYIPVISLINR